jgi:hypothetical protein
MSLKDRLQATIISNAPDDEELTLLEESLPRVLGHQPFAERFTSEVKRHHRWLGVAFFYSDSFLHRSIRRALTGHQHHRDAIDLAALVA